MRYTPLYVVLCIAASLAALASSVALIYAGCFAWPSPTTRWDRAAEIVIGLLVAPLCVYFAGFAIKPSGYEARKTFIAPRVFED